MNENLDPLDPLTEIVLSGQGFSAFIVIERFIWLIIGIFFVVAISNNFRNGRHDQGFFGNKSFLMNIKKEKKKDEDINFTNNKDND